MEISRLEENELKQLKTKRSAIRNFISLAHSEYLSLGVKPDESYLKRQLAELCTAQRKLSGHLIAVNGDIGEGEAATHEEYCAKARAILEPPKAKLHLKKMEVKLPLVRDKDPASWINFKAALERLQKSEISNEELSIQLINAVPTAIANRITNLDLDDALRTVIEHFESREMISSTMRALFRRAKAMERLLELPALRGIRDAVAEMIPLTKDERIRNETLGKAILLMPLTMYFAWTDHNPLEDQQSLESLLKFLNGRVTSVERRLALEPNDRNSRSKNFQPHKQEDKQIKKNISSYGDKHWEKKSKVNTIEKVSDESLSSFDSGDENENKDISELYPCIVISGRDINRIAGEDTCDEESGGEAIMIEGQFGNIRVPLLFDGGARKNLLPASLFVGSSSPKVRFQSATGHPIRTSGAKRFLMKVNDAVIPITAYVNEQNLAILGRPFCKRCSVYSNGLETEKIVYHDVARGKDVVVFQRLPEEKTKPTTNEILQILPCANEDDLIEDDNISDKQKSINPPKQAKISALLCKWQHLGQGLGHTGLVQHRIYTDPNVPPISAPKRRLPVKMIEKAKQAINEMLLLDVIEPSKSPWCFNLVPVHKKDGSLRVAIDFQPLNEVSKKDAFPMPRIDEILESLGPALIFSKLDLLKGYYQIEIHPDDREKTAFHFQGHLYQFKRLPFGLHSAPQTFQRLMNQLLGHLDFARCYLDDIIIFSKNVDEHAKHLEEVFQILEEANLKINSEKCEFGVEEVEFLGFKIGGGKRQLTANKVEKIREFPRPSNKKELDQFLGVVGMYRGLIKSFSAMAQPLFELKNRSKPKTPFEWCDDHQKAFDNLKSELTKPPVVTLPDTSKPFIVRTDASGTGMGAVLLQELDGHRRIIEYASKQFDATQRRYPTIKQEATAVLWALRRWRHFLLGGGFTLETDHRPLLWLDSMINADGVLGRMAMALQQFKPYSITHIPGKANGEADFLSRLVGAIELDYSDQDDISLRQQSHPDDFVTDDLGRLRFIGDGKNRLAIPRKNRKTILRALHDEHGHLGPERVKQLVRDRFFWHRMSDDVEKYCRECHACAISKDSPIAKAEMKPTTTDTTDKLMCWQVDIVGSLRKSTAGNTYVLVAQDPFSKWPEACPVSRAPTASMLIDWLEQAIFNRFGIPKVIVTDRGSQFESKEFTDFLSNKGITHKLGAPYHHQSTGLVERFNRTLESMIRAGAESSNKWDEAVGRCLFAYRTSVHSATKKTPFEVVFNSQARLPLDAELSLDAPSTSLNPDEIRQAVRDSIQVEARKSKDRYDSRFRTKEHRDLNGQKVYWKDLAPKANGKLSPRFKGPFRAHQTDSPWNYRITDKHGKSKLVHVDHLKLCHNAGQEVAAGLRGRGRPPSS